MVEQGKLTDVRGDESSRKITLQLYNVCRPTKTDHIRRGDAQNMKKEDETVYDPENDYQIMLNRLKEICRKKKMTQYALAKATKMSSSSLSYLMNGETKPYITTLLIICKALNISIGDLFENSSTEFSEEEETLVHTYRCLSLEKKKMLMVYIDMLLTYEGEIKE